jgi:hypothetical protein
VLAKSTKIEQICILEGKLVDKEGPVAESGDFAAATIGKGADAVDGHLSSSVYFSSLNSPENAAARWSGCRRSDSASAAHWCWHSFSLR